jgi:branched-chain amino acid transport system permease protein
MAASIPAGGSLSRTGGLGLDLSRFRVTSAGLVARFVAASALVLVVFSIPLLTTATWDNVVSLAAIYGIIGLSVNVITGYAGQISLGQQAFVGIGAFMSAFVVQHTSVGFAGGVLAAALTGAAMALVLGLVALRIRGLYMALVTLSFGLMAQDTIFNWRAFTGGGAGAKAPRPSMFTSNQAFAYLCFVALAVVVLVDWRLAKTKAGRAIVAVRNNERVAATLGISPVRYKLFAFGVGGFLAGLAGSLFAHHDKSVYTANFDLFSAALPWVIMAVVGGLGSRAGIVMSSAFFAVFSYLFPPSTVWTIPTIGQVGPALLPPLIGAVLLLFTVTVYQGGLGQQILPYRRWLAGGRFLEHREEAIGLPGQAFLVGFLVPFAFHLPWAFCLAVGLTGAFITAGGVRSYVRNQRPDLHRRVHGPVAEDDDDPDDDLLEEPDEPLDSLLAETEGPLDEPTEGIPGVGSSAGGASDEPATRARIQPRGLRAFRRRRGGAA